MYDPIRLPHELTEAKRESHYLSHSRRILNPRFQHSYLANIGGMIMRYLVNRMSHNLVEWVPWTHGHPPNTYASPSRDYSYNAGEESVSNELELYKG